MFPDWLVLLFFIAVPAAVAMAAHAVVRRLLPADRLIPHHDVAGYLVAVVGVLYGIVLGFLVITVWSSFDATQRSADLEAGHVATAWASAALLPQPQRAAVQRLLAEYAIEVRDVEWPAMRVGTQDPRARALLLDALNVVNLAPVTADENVSLALRDRAQHDSVLADLHQVFDDRRLRLIEAEGEDRLPPAMYVALVLGALMVLSFVFLFGVKDLALQLTMTGIVAGCIGLLFGLIVELNSPYAGAIHVSPIAWTYVIQNNHFVELPRH